MGTVVRRGQRRNTYRVLVEIKERRSLRGTYSLGGQLVTKWILRWVHTRNVTAYRNAVTLQVTDTIRSYELNFLSLSHDVTVFCER